MLEASLHSSEETEPPLPGFQLPVRIRTFPLARTLAPDLGLELHHALLSLLNQGG